MTVTTRSTFDSIANTTTDADTGLRNIGIELEYPVADRSTRAPATYGNTSSGLRDRARSRFVDPTWPIEGISGGYMGSDHTGAEITSPVLNLHSEEPELWYNRSIEQAEELGYPFAATGQGDTNFGLHFHLSELPEEKADAINDMVADTQWGPIFFTSSVMADSLDPWRHGGVRDLDGDTCFSRAARGGYDDHYEFRLPEPMVPEHFGLVMEYLRRLSNNSIEDAWDFARETVLSCDRRLTAVQQYHLYEEHVDGWPNEECFEDEGGRSRTDRHRAEYFYDLME